MRASPQFLALCVVFLAALGCSEPGQSQEGLATTTPGALPPPSDQAWSSDTGGYGLSFRRFGWDLMSRVRPEAANAQYSIEIISADRVPLFCHATDRAVTAPLKPEQGKLSERIKALAATYVEGSTREDRVGGSKVLGSRVLMAGDVAVLRVQLETLDHARPLLRQELVQFAIAEDRALRYVQIECFVGNGTPPERWGEISQVLDTLRIKGAPTQ